MLPSVFINAQCLSCCIILLQLLVLHAQPSLFGDLPPVSGRERGEGGLGKHPLEAAVDDQQAGGKGAKHQKLSSCNCYMYLMGMLGPGPLNLRPNAYT